MTEWYEKGYMGKSPPVKAPFARNVYPPDAAQYGKTPSQDGPDIVAYKRAISRAGRWPWQSFDDSFSNSFSHGKSPNVQDSGIAGFQRQQHLDATGWIGQKTFDNLRYALVSDPDSNHYLQPLFDDYAVQLLNDAYDRFQGHEPPPPAIHSLRENALDRAISQLGITESPAGSNDNKYGAWYGMNYVPWCAIFTTWCYEVEGDTSPSFVRGSRYSYCPYIVADARANRYGLQTTDDPIPGDLVVYDWSWDTIYDHVGFFESWKSDTQFSAIEGNTSTSNNSNGGEVMRRTRDKFGQGTVFVRVHE
jgi:hypothetical protein